MTLIKKPFFTLLILIIGLTSMGFFHFAHAFGFRFWEQSNNITSGPARANNLTVVSSGDGAGVYVVGYETESGIKHWRIERRDLNSGSLCDGNARNCSGEIFGINGIVTSVFPGLGDLDSQAKAITSDTSGIYVTGYAFYLTATPITVKYDFRGNEIWRQKPSQSVNTVYNAIAIDSSNHRLYLGGRDYPGLVQVLGRISDINTSNPIYDWYKSIASEDNGNSQLNGMVFDGINLYTAGYSQTGNGGYNTDWKIGKLDANGNDVTGWPIRYQLFGRHADDDYATAITLDGSGKLYVAGYSGADGYWVTRKHEASNGALVTTFGNSDTNSVYQGINNSGIYSLAVDDNGNLYVPSEDSGGVSTWWLLEKRSNSTGDIIWSQRGDKVPIANPEFPNGISVDASGNIYMAGYDNRNANTEWRITKTKEQVDANDPIRAVNISNLRLSINLVREKKGLLPNYTWNDSGGAPTAGGTIRANHMNEMVLAINELADRFCVNPTWTDSNINAGQTLVRAAQFNDLSNNLAKFAALPNTGFGNCKRVFLSSYRVSGDLGNYTSDDRNNHSNADGVNARCRDLASRRNLGGEWRAWIRSDGMEISDRMTHSNYRYELLDHTVIANNWDDLTDGTLLHMINMDETGTTVLSDEFTDVWTGGSVGTMSNQCTADNILFGSSWWSHGESDEVGGAGWFDNTSSDWTTNNSQTCEKEARFYCFEQ